MSSWGTVLSIAIGGVSTLCGNSAIAQITSDGTLPINSSIEKDGNIFNITRGTQAGGNLFHSFGEFSVPTDNIAFFNNAGDIQNIISRVTGNSISNIDGLIAANGTANLFLVNPNGIIFGQNAQLDIGGSFFASTASAIKFANGSEFSALTPQTTSILAISVPIGLQFGHNPGSIQNQSQATDSNGIAYGLQVKPGKTLALVGGNITLESGYLTAEGGRIELGSVADGLVSLDFIDKIWVLGYQGVQNFNDIQLSQDAFVDASGESGGDIELRGRRVIVADASRIITSTLGSGSGGALNVSASDSVEVLGTSTDGRFSSLLSTYTEGSGSGSDLTITTKRLIVRDGALIESGTFSEGQGGKLTVNASDSVEVIGISAKRQFSAVLGTFSRGSGSAGDLIIATKNLILQDGSELGSLTLAEGQGGKVTINASNSVEVNHTSGIGLFPTILFTQSAGSGDAGDLTITTKRLNIRDGGRIGAVTFDEGKGGNLTINASDSVEVSGTSVINGLKRTASISNQTQGAEAAGDLTISTPQMIVEDGAEVGTITANYAAKASGNLTITTEQLTVRDGGRILTSSLDTGKSGDLNIFASDSVELKGTGFNRDENSITSSGLFTRSFETGDAGNLTIETRKLVIEDGARISSSTFLGKGGNLIVNASESVKVTGFSDDGQINSGIFAQTVGSGDAGNLRIETGQLIVQNGAEVTVNATDLFGEVLGSAGDIEVVARSIELEKGALRAASSLGNGGNIILQVQDLLLLRQGSKISTNAGTAQQGGDGGNININAKFIVAIPQEDSDITANAFLGTGGNVQISTQGIFGIEARPKPTAESDITASSELGLQGVTNINSPDNDSIQNSLTQLPENLIDTNALIANSCIARNPRQKGTFTIAGSGGLPNRPGNASASTYPTDDVQDAMSDRAIRQWKKGDPIVEAQGVYRLTNGNLVMSRECR
ncbi:Filamentous hemagglutinin FhaB/tRNA nuclease CdiA-like TPS domain-containing protein [Nostoc sp. DSM 114161]|jgi:filamentous hemagglutinin family protein|uniref:two-partner secretion domain-containing protein n=1 Tax=Nostoc sp. DSM 114161 TaxID=3440143 RepID=UPI00404558B9